MKHFVFYTNWFIPSRFGAFTYGPIIFIRPSERENLGLLAHEQTHARQFWRNPFMFIPYTFSKKARMAYEVEAFKEQLKHNPENINAFAAALATKYNLGISFDEALAALNG